MASVGYNIVTGSAVSASAATIKSMLGVKAHANSGLQVKSFEISFDGVTGTAVPVLVELCMATFATSAPGTNSTTVIPVQSYGRSLAAGFTAAKSWTTEPTVLSTIKEFLVAPDKGLFAYQFPLGQEPDCALGEGFVIRVNAPAAVNARISMSVERV